MTRADLLWWQRRYADAIAIVESVPDTPDNFGGRGAASKPVILGRYHLDMGDIARARQYFSQVEGPARRALAEVEDRQSVVGGQSVSVGVDLGGRPIIKKKKKT